MHAVWLAKKVIELVCSAGAAQAAHDYTGELNSSSSKEVRRNSGTGGLSARERELRAAFMEAARQELGYTGEPLQQRAYADQLQHDPRSHPSSKAPSLSGAQPVKTAALRLLVALVYARHATRTTRLVRLELRGLEKTPGTRNGSVERVSALRTSPDWP